MSRIILTVVLISLCFSGDGSHLLAQEQTPGEQRCLEADYLKIKRVNFHYVIYRSHIYGERPSDVDSGVKNLHLLVDEDAFTLENLQSLFQAISKGFPKQEGLNTFIHTSIKQVNIDGFFMSHSPEPPELFKHHRAYYHRDAKNEFYRYTKTPTSVDLETVVLKGKAFGSL
jgi:hypothetical protein